MIFDVPNSAALANLLALVQSFGLEQTGIL
jgi:hypothetical protein